MSTWGVEELVRNIFWWIVACVVVVVVGIILAATAKYTRSVKGKFLQGTVDGSDIVVTRASYEVGGETYTWLAKQGDRLLIPASPAPVVGVTEVDLYYDAGRPMDADYKRSVSQLVGIALILYAIVVLIGRIIYEQF